MTNELELEEITPDGSAVPVFINPAQTDPLPDLSFAEDVDVLRYRAYTAPGGPDSIYMKWQRGDATEQDWLNAVQAVKDQYPDQ